MNKTLIALITGIFLLSIFSIQALELKAGESTTLDFSGEADVIDNITYEVVNNTFNLDGLNITIHEPFATISTTPNYKPDNFTIIFTINGKNEVSVSSGGGGSSSTPKSQEVTSEELKQGKSVNLKRKDKVNFNLKNPHTLTLGTIYSDSALVIIQSDTHIFTVKEGETIDACINEEEDEAVKITLEEIKYNSVDLKISESVCPTKTKEEPKEEPEPKEDKDPEEPKEEPDSKLSKFEIAGIVALVLLIITIIYVTTHHPPKKKEIEDD